MKFASFAVVALLVSLASPALALDDTSLASAWASADQTNKDAWVQAYKFEKADVDRAEVAKCLDKMTAWEALSTNKLTGVTSMCETMVEKGAM